MQAEIDKCRGEVELKILKLEGEIKADVEGIKKDVANIQKTLNTLVTKERFEPVAYIAYGLAAGVLTTALGAILSQVFIK